MSLALLIVLAAAVVVLCLFVVALHRRVQLLEGRVGEIEEELNDAWVVVIPKDIDHEWAWPERKPLDAETIFDRERGGSDSSGG